MKKANVEEFFTIVRIWTRPFGLRGSLQEGSLFRFFINYSSTFLPKWRQSQIHGIICRDYLSILSTKFSRQTHIYFSFVISQQKTAWYLSWPNFYTQLFTASTENFCKSILKSNGFQYRLVLRAWILLYLLSDQWLQLQL